MVFPHFSNKVMICIDDNINNINIMVFTLTFLDNTNLFLKNKESLNINC